ncbi:serine hydrolase domain-containing protein [Maricaulis parjimensis]|uniref:serine hydrolase domain-containing protein n=1 Tax=Maricaulis parjimensis TaxID=144023 RepID=UPI00193A61B5|nr:serine hydrolase domain-containing protein [Maricaulis parjimensis]
MWREIILSAQLLVLASAPSALAQADLQPLADQLLADSGAPGAVVAHGQADRLDMAVAGLRAAGSEALIAPGDIWHLGSNSKSMTATLVARLVEQGVVDWDDTVAEHLGDAIETIDPAYRDITFLHLLSHRAGLPANVGLVSTFGFISRGDEDLPAQRLDYAADILAQSPAGEAETGFLYSNAGYVVVGAMLEQATGESWESLITREVFEPLGLESAGFGAPGTAGDLDQPRGHKRGLFGGLGAVEPGPRADNPPVMGPGATVHMSVEDLGVYLQAHLAGARGEETGFLSAQSWQILHTPPFGGTYALGWGINGSRLYHAGSNTMWLVQMGLDVEAGEVLVVGINAPPSEAASDAVRTATGAVFD